MDVGFLLWVMEFWFKSQGIKRAIQHGKPWFLYSLKTVKV